MRFVAIFRNHVSDEIGLPDFRNIVSVPGITFVTDYGPAVRLFRSFGYHPASGRPVKRLVYFTAHTFNCSFICGESSCCCQTLSRSNLCPPALQQRNNRHLDMRQHWLELPTPSGQYTVSKSFSIWILKTCSPDQPGSQTWRWTKSELLLTPCQRYEV